MSPGRWQHEAPESALRGAGQHDEALFCCLDWLACAMRHSICGGSSSQKRQHFRSHIIWGCVVTARFWFRRVRVEGPHFTGTVRHGGFEDCGNKIRKIYNGEL